MGMKDVHGFFTPLYMCKPYKTALPDVCSDRLVVADRPFMTRTDDGSVWR